MLRLGTRRATIAALTPIMYAPREDVALAPITQASREDQVLLLEGARLAIPSR